MKKNKHCFCSRECQSIWLSANLQGENNHCYIKNLPRYENGRINEYQIKDTKIHCVYCGKEAYVSGLLLKNRKIGNTCSQECLYNLRSSKISGNKHPNFKGGNRERYYGENWYRQRRKARKRDNNICQKCGISKKDCKKNLSVHHIIPFNEFGLAFYQKANRLENLICLCGSCHIKQEKEDYKKFQSLLQFCSEVYLLE